MGMSVFEPGRTAANLTADFEAIDSGHHNIEYSQVKYLSIKQCEGRIARVATRDGKPSRSSTCLRRSATSTSSSHTNIFAWFISMGEILS